MVRVIYRCGHEGDVLSRRDATGTRRRALRHPCLDCAYRQAMNDPTVAPLTNGTRAQIVAAYNIRSRLRDRFAYAIIQARLRHQDDVAQVLWNIRRTLGHKRDAMRIMRIRDQWDEILERYEQGEHHGQQQ